MKHMLMLWVFHKGEIQAYTNAIPSDHYASLQYSISKTQACAISCDTELSS